MYTPKRYIPSQLSRKDRKKQLSMIRKSKRLYKKNRFYQREKLSSFHSKKSGHIVTAEKMYGVDSIQPNNTLSRKTGCSIAALKKIVNKGQGAYYSSGSRPNQTAQSWGLARLASAITSGKAAAVDFNIIDKGCNHNKKAYKLALKQKKKTRKNR